jgi:hypothetical protein
MFTRPESMTDQKRSPRSWQNWGVAFLLVQGAVLFQVPAIAQPVVTTATIREILDGNQVFIQDRPARVNDIGRLRQQVRTAAARAGLLFNDSPSGVRLGQKSSMVVGSQCIQLLQGKVLISGKVGLNGCVGRVTVRPVGTVYIMSLDEQGGQVTVLDGTVEVFNTDNPGTSVKVGAGQSVEITAAGNLATTASGNPTPPQTLSQSQLVAVSAPLIQGFQVPLPGLDNVAFLKPREGFTPTFLRDALVGREGTFAEPNPQRGESALIIKPIDSAEGTFIRDTNNSGRFISDSGTIVPISVDFDAQTISIGGTSGTSSSVGLSGRNATGTVILRNGEAIRLQVFDVELKEPRIGTPFRGSLIRGVVRDR